MEQVLLALLISCGVPRVTGSSLDDSKLFYFVNQSKTFDEAQLYCRDHYTDLVTLSDRGEMQELFGLENFLHTESAWIGLRKTRLDRWQWSLADRHFYREGESEYANWGPNEPTGRSGEFCSVMDDKGKIRDTTCEVTRTFICYSGQGYNGQKYVLVSNLKAWREAQMYCRQFHTDLVSVRNTEENLQIQQLIPAGGVPYIGLFKDAYAWSDSGRSSFRNWALLQPDELGECVVLQLKNHMWDSLRCSDSRPFFCYANPVFRQTVRLELDSHLNVNDPEVKASILQQIKQKLLSQGMTERAQLQWKRQENGNIFQTAGEVKA